MTLSGCHHHSRKFCLTLSHASSSRACSLALALILVCWDTCAKKTTYQARHAYTPNLARAFEPLSARFSHPRKTKEKETSHIRKLQANVIVTFDRQRKQGFFHPRGGARCKELLSWLASRTVKHPCRAMCVVPTTWFRKLSSSASSLRP